jgi:hypothetical protein
MASFRSTLAARQRAKAASRREARWLPALSGSGRWLLGVVAGVLVSVLTVIAVQYLGDAAPIESGPPITAFVAVKASDTGLDALPTPLRSGATFERLTRHGAPDGAWNDFVAQAGGAPVVADLTLVLEGRRTQTVRVIDVRPRVVSRGPPFTGTLLTRTAEGEQEVPNLVGNLDLPLPTFRDSSQAEQSYFQTHQVDLAKNERFAFGLRVVGRRASYVWDIEVTYLDRSGSHTMYVSGPDGRPFRLAGQLDDITGYAVRYRRSDDGRFTADTGRP